MSDFPIALPFPESYWVVPGLFMAGEYPAGYDELETRRRIQGLLQNGITSFIDLTHPDDFLSGYDEILQDEATGYSKSVKYHHEPIQDRSVPTKNKMAGILDNLDECIREHEPVYVHCIAGIGRTGTVVGCYLVRHGVKGEDVMNEVRLLRRKIPSHWARSPEADTQVDFILCWKAGC